MRPLLIAALALAGCGDKLTFPCQDDSFCVRSGQTGRCLAGPSGVTRYCAFADSGCGSNLKWDPTAGEDLAGTCTGGGGGDMGATDMPVTVVKWSSLNSGAQDAFYGVSGANGVTFVVGPAGVFRSDDGVNWMDVSPPVADGGNPPIYTNVWVSRAKPVYVTASDGLLFKSTDNGKTWTTPPTGTLNRLNCIWGLSDGTVDELFAAGETGTVVHSTDSGATWAVGNYDPMQNGWTLNNVWGSAADNVFYVGDAGTVVRTQNRNQTFSLQTTATQAALESVWGSAADDVWVVGEGQTVLHFDGKGWKTAATLGVPTSFLFSVYGFAADDIYAVGRVDDNGGAAAYHWSGASWFPVSLDGQYPTLFAVWGSGPNDLFAVGVGGVILHGE